MSGSLITKVLVVLLGAALLFILFSGDEDDIRQPIISNDAKKGVGDGTAQQAGGDTPNTVLKTVSAQLDEVKDENAELRAQNHLILDRMEAIQKEMVELRQQPQPETVIANEKDSIVDEVIQRIDKLAPPTPRTGQGTGREREPTGTGQYDIGYGRTTDPGYAGPVGTGDNTYYVEIAPMRSSPAEATAGNRRRANDGGILGSKSSSDNDTPQKSGDGAKTSNAKIVPEPRYTIPVNATLLENRTMTALIGRVPKSGQVRDPFPFKIVTGADNYVANGATLPDEVAGVVWSGLASGDDTFECVRGEIQSVTFVFDDGTVYTQGTNTSSGGGQRLGYIADSAGNPCIKGQLVSNASKLLGATVLTTAFEAGAEAAAAAQTTTTSNDNTLGGSSITTSVTGDRGDFILGRTIAGGLDETTAFIRERMKDLFDAVYVPPGKSVQISIDTQITIDYDPIGRKLEHVASADENRVVAGD